MPSEVSDNVRSRGADITRPLPAPVARVGTSLQVIIISIKAFFLTFTFVTW